MAPDSETLGGYVIDIACVRKNDREVIDGESAVDKSVATGESVPVEKQVGDEVIGGSVNETGTLLIEVNATGDDAFLQQVAH